MSNASERLGAVVRELRKLKDRKEEIAEEEKAINKQIAAIEAQTLPEMMESEGLSAFKVPGVGSISLKNETYVYVPADKRADLHQVLKANGNGDLVTETVNHNTLQSWVKEQLAEGNEIPDEIKLTFVKLAKLRRS